MAEGEIPMTTPVNPGAGEGPPEVPGAGEGPAGGPPPGPGEAAPDTPASAGGKSFLSTIASFFQGLFRPLFGGGKSS
jgi:hypothetical protein